MIDFGVVDEKTGRELSFSWKIHQHPWIVFKMSQQINFNGYNYTQDRQKYWYGKQQKQERKGDWKKDKLDER